MNRGDDQGPIDGLKSLWTLEEPPERIDVEDLRREVSRRRRRMLWTVGGEIVLTLGLVVLSLGLLGGPEPASPRELTWVGLLWLTWLIIVGFATWNRWGIWQPSGETARSYLALSEERARRRKRAATFVLGLVSVQFVLLLAFGENRLPGLVVVSLYTGWAGWYRWRAVRDLAAIRRIAEEFGTGDRPA
jgi:hypothetical protein